MKAKFTCTHTSTIAFDNHQVVLESEDHSLTIRYKKSEDFATIAKGDTVEVEIPVSEAKAAPKAAAAKKRSGR